MENTNNPDQQRVDQNSGGPLEGMSPQNTNMPENNEEEDAVVYAGLGVNNRPDIMNPGDEEASDTLYTPIRPRPVTLPIRFRMTKRPMSSRMILRLEIYQMMKSTRKSSS